MVEALSYKCFSGPVHSRPRTFSSIHITHSCCDKVKLGARSRAVGFGDAGAGGRSCRAALARGLVNQIVVRYMVGSRRAFYREAPGIKLHLPLLRPFALFIRTVHTPIASTLHNITSMA